MKKVLSLFLALALVLSLSAACFAAETETEIEYIYDQTMIDPEVYDGEWYTFALEDYDLFDLYLPKDFERLQLTDEQIEDRCLWYYSDGDHSLLIAEYTPEEMAEKGVESNADLVNYLIGIGYADAKEFITNSYYCVLEAGNPDYLSCGVWILYSDGSAIKLLMWPYDNEEAQNYIINIICSLSEPGT